MHQQAAATLTPSVGLQAFLVFLARSRGQRYVECGDRDHLQIFCMLLVREWHFLVHYVCHFCTLSQASWLTFIHVHCMLT